VEHSGQRFALLVDELLGQQQVVVKSLEANYHKVEGVLGATILGNGRAALILDVAGLAQLARRAGCGEWAA
jgi:two-component system chemotaxis sensor kinase CheA